MTQEVSVSAYYSDIVEEFHRDGVVLVRGLVDRESLVAAQTAWRHCRAIERCVNPRNPGEVCYTDAWITEHDHSILRSMARYPAVLDIAEALLGPHVGLYNERIMVKDDLARGPVFLHHDVAYHQGQQNKLSAFIALSSSCAENGGLIFYPGTHVFGHLGDAGEINRELLGQYDLKPYAPVMRAGDVVFMHSSTWHESPEWQAGEDRVLMDVIYQPASDLTTKEVVRGECGTLQYMGYGFNDTLRRKPFERSRVSRIKDLETDVTAYKYMINSSNPLL